MRYLLFSIVTLLCLTGASQNTIGLPDIINFKKATYHAGLQNWDFKQDQTGLLYVANNEGMLSFDGRNWQLHPLPNKTIVRSLEIVGDSIIYVGGQGEMGYFRTNQSGSLVYTSLIDKIPFQDRNFSDVWDIVVLTDDVLFRCSNQIFYYTKNQIRVFRPSSEWGFMGIANGKAYAQDYETGIWVFQNKKWELLPTASVISKNDPITSIIATGKDSALISTLKNGLYEMIGQQIKKIKSPNQGLFINDRIYAATAITSNRIALATNNNGVYIIDKNGNIIQRFSKKEGLQHNNVLSLFCDNDQNLWLGLDNGIDFIAFNSAIKQISPSQEDGAGYTMATHNNQLYIGTSNGLFSAPLKDSPDKSYTLANFNKIPGTDGQVWSLSEYNNELLMGHHEGGFVIKNNNAIPFSSGLTKELVEKNWHLVRPCDPNEPLIKKPKKKSGSFFISNAYKYY